MTDTQRRLLAWLSHWLPVLLWAGLIISLSLRPDPAAVVPQGVAGPLASGLPTSIGLDQAGHVLLYAVLGALLLRLASWRLPPELAGWPVLAWALYASAAVALLDETIQHFVPGRAFQLNDLALDLSAALAGAAALLLIRRLLPVKELPFRRDN